VLFELGRFDAPSATEWHKFKLEDINSTFHQQIAYEAALQSLVLLQNDGALPLKQGQRVAVVGPQGVTRSGLLSDYAADQVCFNGTDVCIGTIAEGIAASNVGGQTTSSQGVEVNSSKTDGIQAALDSASAADVVVLVLGNDKTIEHEGLDRSDTALPGLQEAFAFKVLALGKPTVLVLTNGGALAIDKLVAPSVKAPYAIVESFNPSVVGGKAIGASLFGLENRWGKLPVTMYPHDFIKESSMTDYDMTSGVGRTYRYYTGKPLFPFGHGLSLTTFKLSCSSEKLDFACTVANVGGMLGDEVVQVYHNVQPVQQMDHPLPQRALVDFARVTVPAHGSAGVNFHLTEDALKVVNKAGARVLYPGRHTLIFSRGHGDEQNFTVNVPTSTVQHVFV